MPSPARSCPGSRIAESRKYSTRPADQRTAVLRGVDLALGLGGENSQVDVGTALEEVAEILGLRADFEDAVLSGEGGAEKVVEEELSVVGLDHRIRDGGPALL
jgi:hypothetical protein